MERRTRAIVASFAAAKVLLHAFSITHYGWFRDELYYIACSERLAFGYVDHPPFSIVVLRLMRAVLGDSLVAVRVTPLSCGVLQIVLSGVLAHRFGARALGVAMACAATLGAPLLMAFSHHYSMNALDGLLWTASLLLLQTALTKARTRDWVMLGVVLGAGLMNKASVLWLGAGIGLALITFHRDALRTRGPWLTAAIALALFLPNVVWQMRNHWPTVEFAKNALAGKYVPLSRLDFVKEVVLQAGPAGALLFVLALIAPFVSPASRPHRFLALTLAAVLLILLVQRASKPEYLGAAFPSAFALGASVIDRWASTRTRALAVTAPWALLLAAYAAVVAPFAIPLLSVERFVRYQSALGMKPQTSEKKQLGRLPQYYADMFGWPELAAEVERVTMTLTPDERAHAVIFSATGGYGPASAIELFTRGHGLPRVVCGHNNWWLWGYGDGTATNAIVVGGAHDDIARVFDSVELATTFECGDCMPYENHKPIWIARGLRVPLATLWPAVKHYE